MSFNQETTRMTHLNATPAPETKAGDLSLAMEDLRYAFEAFRQTNDERLADIERRSADPLTEEKLSRIERTLDDAKRRIDRVTLDQRRPVIGEPQKAVADASQGEHKQAFLAYVRSGESSGLKRLEEKALSAGSGPDGGYLAPAQLETEVMSRLPLLSPIRAISGVRTISGGSYKKAYSTVGASAGWVGETAARPQTNSPTLAELNFPAMELYAMPAATQSLLDDAVVDIDRWVADEVEMAFAEQEGQAFVNGDGVNKPRGVLNFPQVANATWSWGNIGMINTGVAGALPAANPSDVLIDLIYALRGGYRQNASFVLNRKVQSTIRKLKDTQGNYLWQPPAVAGGQATLMGFPVVEAEDMPDIAAGSVSVLFGDFRRGYLVVDRTGLRVLRDPYSAKPYVLFYVTKRVGGGVQDFAAIKGLRFAV
jgi:HK97 family phage major capsid protein